MAIGKGLHGALVGKAAGHAHKDKIDLLTQDVLLFEQHHIESGCVDMKLSLEYRRNEGYILIVEATLGVYPHGDDCLVSR